ncbi:hypothetical protein B6E78_08600 [Edwardsiella ictaluri]|nr:hypothetical protein B6E78_08600 [Edwardsiella ictaluri]
MGCVAAAVQEWYFGQLTRQAHRIWRGADINYLCGRRQADRVLYSDNGLIYVTHDHYRHFTRMG